MKNKSRSRDQTNRQNVKPETQTGGEKSGEESEQPKPQPPASNFMVVRYLLPCEQSRILRPRAKLNLRGRGTNSHKFENTTLPITTHDCTY